MRVQTIILTLVLVVLVSVVGYGTYFVVDSLSNRTNYEENISGDSQETEKASDENETKENGISEGGLINSGRKTENPENKGPQQAEEGSFSDFGENEGGESGMGESEEPVSSEGEQTPTEPEVPKWQQPEEPEASAPMEESEIPEEAFEITMTAEGINPSSFEVKRSEKLMLSITSGDSWTHVFKFEDENLKDAIVGVAPNETRVITFYAPDEPGEYEFHCDLPGHAARGETGKMVVK